MISPSQVDRLRGAKVRIVPTSKEVAPATGTLHVVDHEIPVRGQSLNLEIPQASGQSITLQLTGSEAKQLANAPAQGEREFRWNGKRRALRPVPREDLLVAAPEPATVF